MTRDNSRFLMLFIDSEITRCLLMERLPRYKRILEQQNSLERRSLVMLEGSRLQHDIGNQKYYLNILSRLKTHITEGDFVVFSELDNIYGILYDLFNQRFSMDSNTTSFCQINYGDMRDRINIHAKFGCMLLKSVSDFVRPEGIERRLPSPLLNRFEKHILTLENYTSNQDIKDAIARVKGLLRDCLQNSPVFDRDKRRSWTELGNQLIFCFHDGQLVDYICIKWEQQLRGRSGENVLERYEEVFNDLVRFFSCKMMVLFLEWVSSEFGTRARKIQGNFEHYFLRIHKLNSLADVIGRNKIAKSMRSMVFTFTKKTNYRQEGFTRLSSKNLDNEGFRTLENELNSLKQKPEHKGILVCIEESGQFSHLSHLKRFVDNYIDNNRAELGGKQVIFVVHQTGLAGDRAKVFYPNQLVGGGGNAGSDWDLQYLDDLGNSYYR